MAGSPGSKGNEKGRRALKQKVKTAKGRKLSSTLWLERQLNDPYVAAAQRDGYRSRAAYKLLEIDDKYHLLKPGLRVVDLGSAPGGWSQICARRVRAPSAVQEQPSSAKQKNIGQVVAIDLTPVDEIPGVTFLECDFMDEDAPQRIRALLDGEKVDAVLSDMAAPATGHRKTDHLRIMGLCEAALDYAREVLADDGFFLAKVLQGGTERELLNDMKRDFKTVRHVKPKASRADSSELYVLATGFRGG